MVKSVTNKISKYFEYITKLSADHHPSLLCIHSVFVVIIIFLFLAISHVGSQFPDQGWKPLRPLQ